MEQAARPQALRNCSTPRFHSVSTKIFRKNTSFSLLLHFLYLYMISLKFRISSHHLKTRKIDENDARNCKFPQFRRSEFQLLCACVHFRSKKPIQVQGGTARSDSARKGSVPFCSVSVGLKNLSVMFFRRNEEQNMLVVIPLTLLLN